MFPYSSEFSLHKSKLGSSLNRHLQQNQDSFELNISSETSQHFACVKNSHLTHKIVFWLFLTALRYMEHGYLRVINRKQH